MTPGFIYRGVAVNTAMILPSSHTQSTETPVFLTAEILYRSIINDLNGLNCDERLDFLRNYKIPDNVMGVPVFYVPDNAHINFSFNFEPISNGDGYITIILKEAYTAPLLGGDVYWQFNRSITKYLGDFENRTVAYESPIRGLSVQFYGVKRVTPPGQTDEFTTANVTVSVTVNRVVDIDINYFLLLYPECEYPPLPNPNNSPQAIITPSDNIGWREEWKMSLPPAETKQPLANNSLPLNILRFLK